MLDCSVKIYSYILYINIHICIFVYLYILYLSPGHKCCHVGKGTDATRRQMKGTWLGPGKKKKGDWLFSLFSQMKASLQGAWTKHCRAKDTAGQEEQHFRYAKPPNPKCDEFLQLELWWEDQGSVKVKKPVSAMDLGTMNLLFHCTVCWDNSYKVLVIVPG